MNRVRNLGKEVMPSAELSLSVGLPHSVPGDQSSPDTPGSCQALPPPRAASSPRVWGGRSSPPPQHGLSASLRMLGTEAFSWKTPGAWVTQTDTVRASQRVPWMRLSSASSGRSFRPPPPARPPSRAVLLVLSAGPAPSSRGGGQPPSVRDPLIYILKIIPVSSVASCSPTHPVAQLVKNPPAMRATPI